MKWKLKKIILKLATIIIKPFLDKEIEKSQGGEDDFEERLSRLYKK